MTADETFSLIDDCSPYLKALRESHAEFAARVMDNNPDEELNRLCASLDETRHLSTQTEAARLLRQGKQKLALLVALCDISGKWKLAQVTEALTRFADAAVNAALAFLWCQEQAKGTLRADAPVGQAYLILAMGKMGAFELNYSSDIDLIVFYDPQTAPLADGAEPALFFVKLTRNLVSLLQDVTEDGYVFRTDLRLRPDPRATQVAINIEAAANYYETQGQNWERAAMIKARACAGDAELAREFMARMRPYIWRKYLDFAAIADVQSMKRQIHAVKGHGEIAVMGHNLKLGRGGIREIEFFAQTQQLIAGGRNPALRCIKTCDALDALAAAKWIALRTAAELKDAYAFLRMLEHRAQMVNDQQTHETPSDPAQFETYARFAGFSSGEELATKLRTTLQCVQDHYAALFEAAPDLGTKEGSLVFTGSDDDPATLETLRRLGYSQVEQVAAIIRAWHFGRYRATRTARARELLTELMPLLLKALADGGDADRAFFAFDKFLASLSSGVQLLSMLKASPRMLALIAQVLGSAPRLAEKISSRPRILEAVTAPDFFSTLPSAEALRAELDALIPAEATLEDAMDIARTFAREKNFRVGVRILSETLSAEEAGLGFSTVADVVLTRLLAAVENEMAAKHGALKGGRCAVLGLGKLGGREMTAASDLDIMVIYDHDPKAEQSNGIRALAPTQYYMRLTQMLVAALSAPTGEGILYQVDMRLRPSGSKGPLAVSVASFESYHKAEAWTWERMAMTRARSIAGDQVLARRVEAILVNVFAAPRDPAKTRSDIADMRALMLRENPPDNLWDLKRAPGGQTEIEFIAQYFELIASSRHQGLLNPNTAHVLTAARAAKLLKPRDAEILETALGLYQRLTHVLRLCIDGRFEAQTAPPRLLETLCQAAGQPDLSATEALLAENQETVAAIFETLIGRP